ncbi:hypothetical protein [Rufibacter roseolus]|uniref:hypothetical protein n=1 Tax=Rufibacter roseolus TaxID=2817375 RepID=UPI001B301D12|nr:hypothetical protein [Rufibacter roseolus]
MVTRFTHNLQALKVSQFIFAVGFVFVFLRYAPFHRVIKVLFCFGYYGLFEYGVLSRLYALELFTMFLVCALYPKRFTHWFLYLVLLAVNAQTHLFGLYFSGVMGLLLFTEALGFWKNVPFREKISHKKLAAGILIWTLGCGVSFWSITHFLGFGQPHILDPYKIQQASTRIWQSFFPVPEFTFHFWNTSYLKTRYEIPLSILLVLLFIYSLKSSRLLVSLFLMYAALFYFFAFKFELYLRHHAHFFLFTMAMFWVSASYNHYPPSIEVKNLFSFKNRTQLFSGILLLAVVAQALTGLYAVSMDYRYSFHPAKDVAAFLQKNYPNQFLASTDDFHASTIGAYMERPIFNLSRGEMRTFFDFDDAASNYLTPFQNLQWAQALAQKKKTTILIISSKKIATEFSPYSVKLIKSFEYNYILLFDKHTYLYLMEPNYLQKPYLVAGTPVALPAAVNKQ